MDCLLLEIYLPRIAVIVFASCLLVLNYDIKKQM